MKRRIYFQVSIILYIGLALLLAIIIAAIYYIVEFFKSIINKASILEWLELLAAIGGFFYMSYTFWRIARNRIILDKNEIFVPGHIAPKDNKIQYETHIPYRDIENIFLVITEKNSLNKTSRFVFTPMPYVVFDCKDGSQKLVNVYYFSKRQVISIMDETISRAKLLGNDLKIKSGEEIYSEFKALEKIKTKSRNNN